MVNRHPIPSYFGDMSGIGSTMSMLNMNGSAFSILRAEERNHRAKRRAVKCPARRVRSQGSQRPQRARDCRELWGRGARALDPGYRGVPAHLSVIVSPGPTLFRCAAVRRWGRAERVSSCKGAECDYSFIL